MRVLFVARTHIGLSAGGLQTQIHRTAESLRCKGVDVIYFDPWKNQIGEVDLVHFFSSFSHQMVFHYSEAKRKSKPIIMSPVFGNAQYPTWVLRALGKCARYIPGFMTHLRELRTMLAGSDRVIALNSEERMRIARAFGISTSRMSIVPNGIDKRFAGGDAGLFESRYGLRNFVLQVGSIDPNKNQLLTIKAVAGLSRDLVLLGEPLLGIDEDLRQCRTLSGRNVHFLGKLDYQDPALPAAFAAARVLVLPSYSEVMPLCLYEAAMAGCHVVISKNVAVDESIRPYVQFVHPDKPEEMRAAIEASFKSKPDARLGQIVAAMPDWDDVADEIIKVYELSFGAGAAKGIFA